MAPRWFLCVLLLVFAISLPGAARTTVTITTHTTSQGRTSTYTSTITAVRNPVENPTLVYNCAKLPAICNNIDKINALDPGTRALVGVQFLNFHFDTNEKRKTERRNQVCRNFHDPGIHPCPEIDQPAVVVKGGWTDPSGVNYAPAFEGRTFQNPLLRSSGAQSRLIADLEGKYQGMYWSCDEWPPASFLEGGQDSDLNRYCTPMSTSCVSFPANVQNLLGNTQTQESEQNWQGKANLILRNWGLGDDTILRGNTDVIFDIRFQTTFQAGPNAPAAWVIYRLLNSRGVLRSSGVAGRQADPIEGSEESLIEVTHEVHTNGSEIIRRRPLGSGFPATSLASTQSSWNLSSSGIPPKVNLTTTLPLNSSMATLQNSSPLWPNTTAQTQGPANATILSSSFRTPLPPTLPPTPSNVPKPPSVSSSSSAVPAARSTTQGVAPTISTPPNISSSLSVAPGGPIATSSTTSDSFVCTITISGTTATIYPVLTNTGDAPSGTDAGIIVIQPTDNGGTAQWVIPTVISGTKTSVPPDQIDGAWPPFLIAIDGDHGIQGWGGGGGGFGGIDWFRIPGGLGPPELDLPGAGSEGDGPESTPQSSQSTLNSQSSQSTSNSQSSGDTTVFVTLTDQGMASTIIVNETTITSETSLSPSESSALSCPSNENCGNYNEECPDFLVELDDGSEYYALTDFGAMNSTSSSTPSSLAANSTYTSGDIASGSATPSTSFSASASSAAPSVAMTPVASSVQPLPTSPAAAILPSSSVTPVVSVVTITSTRYPLQPGQFLTTITIVHSDTTGMDTTTVTVTLMTLSTLVTETITETLPQVSDSIITTITETIFSTSPTSSISFSEPAAATGFPIPGNDFSAMNSTDCYGSDWGISNASASTQELGAFMEDFCTGLVGRDISWDAPGGVTGYKVLAESLVGYGCNRSVNFMVELSTPDCGGFISKAFCEQSLEPLVSPSMSPSTPDDEIRACGVEESGNQYWVRGGQVTNGCLTMGMWIELESFGSDAQPQSPPCG